MEYSRSVELHGSVDLGDARESRPAYVSRSTSTAGCPILKAAVGDVGRMGILTLTQKENTRPSESLDGALSRLDVGVVDRRPASGVRKGWGNRLAGSRITSRPRDGRS